MDFSERLKKLKALLDAERRGGRAPRQPVPAEPAAPADRVELHWDRDSVCMGDDCDSHRKTVEVDGDLTLSALLCELAAYVPAMGSHVVWSVRTEEEAVGYIMGGGRDAPVELAGEDRAVRSLRSKWIDCGYYYESRFSWIDGKTGERVEAFPECPTLLEKVKRKEACWRASCAVMADLSSRDPQRIWSGACQIVKRGQEPDWIRQFYHRAEDIERTTRGVELGGGIAPNRRFVDYALETIRYHREGRGCPCGLYPMTGGDCIFDPKAEEEKGWVRISDTVRPEGEDRYVDHYIVKCTRCGQTYRVEERTAHWTAWRWEKLAEAAFADYPPAPKGNPFDKNAQGKYFAYLTNRKKCFSLLSDDLADFQYQNPALYQAMPMGYTTLCVLERVSVKCGGETVCFAQPGAKLTHFYCKVIGEAYTPISQYAYEQLQKEDPSRAVELSANVLDEYNWH